MTHKACESKLCSVLRSSMHPYPGIRVAIGRAVVYYAWTDREFSAGIKCRHCTQRPFSLWNTIIFPVITYVIQDIQNTQFCCSM